MENKLLIIDNFDSFTYNLYQQIQKLYKGCVEVHRNNQISIEEIKAIGFEAIVISPGPKRPENAGISMNAIRIFADKLPILGICLGMQCINEVYGGITTLSNFPVHGKTTLLNHNKKGIFAEIPKNIRVARYHSLKIDDIQNELEICATTDDNIPMAIRHKKHPIFGLQFHPESFLTEKGDELIRNFLSYV